MKKSLNFPDNKISKETIQKNNVTTDHGTMIQTGITCREIPL